MTWTDADAAELDCMTWELVDSYFTHRGTCEACKQRSHCPQVFDAIETVLGWRQRRSLLSRAEALRIERTLFEAAA